MHEINNIEMVECMVFGKRAKNSRCIYACTLHALHVNKTFTSNLYRARLQKLFFIVLEKNNRITEYSAQIKSKSGFASEFDPQLTQKLSKVKCQIE